MKLMFTLTRASVDAVVRVIVAQIKYDYANITTSDFVENSGLALQVLSPYNRDFIAPLAQAARTHVLYDETITVDTYHPLHFREVLLTKFPLPYIRYLESGGSYAPVDGGLVMWSAGSVAATTPELNMTSRVEFIDS